MPITKLDLGGTTCYGTKKAVSISLDGSTSDDEDVINLIGDYNFMPFKDETFNEALGSCYLEAPYDPFELFRVMKKGGIVTVKGCSISGPEEHMLALSLFKRVGFKVIENNEPYFEQGESYKEWTYDSPIVFGKPKGDD